MIRIKNIETHGWEAAIRGMRNPMNSWALSDSKFCSKMRACNELDCPYLSTSIHCAKKEGSDPYIIGPNDHTLMMKLARAGTDHAKFRRMITVTMDILAPLYWWKEFDTYKVGTVANSCSTMHKITEKKFTLDDFSRENLFRSISLEVKIANEDTRLEMSSDSLLYLIVQSLNTYRTMYLKESDSEMKKLYWWQIIQLLPSSYNQRRTVQLNYEVLANIYKSRREHKLDEWREFCTIIERLPYSEIITLQEEN